MQASTQKTQLLASGGEGDVEIANAFFRRARPPRKAERKTKNRSKGVKKSEGEKVVRNLGVDFACGRGLPARPVQQGRIKGILRRMPLIKRLRQAGANLTAIASCAPGQGTHTRMLANSSR